ncbi:MAG: hypothetical protein H6819_07655 [Phycisphaerales bacterium]|nr:hypothetical protein [Phycisphaerales bacterium]MCB9857630.1 hypothetical protein [Phycisphaerales bacterium]MCB9864813.1 hypothetical protein [Phycisphaerales bacterium]
MTTPSARIRLLLFLLVAIGGAAIVSPEAVIVFVSQGAVSCAILIGAFGLGRLLMSAVPARDCPIATQFVLAAALGTGALSLLVLGLGAMGIMHRGAWISVIAFLNVVAVWQVARSVPSLRAESASKLPDECGMNAMRWMCVATAAFLALGILASTMPPGSIWQAEGNGYDVLEYHLGAPRDYFDAGRIGYLPNNIYSNFPFGIEMLYLLSMILHGDAVRAVYTAKIVNLLLGVLAVLAIWRVGSRVSPRVGLAAGVLAGTAPFLVYLSGVAYVENGMLFFASSALLASLSVGDAKVNASRRSLLAGVLAGFAVGCKYTALPMIALPLVGFVFVDAVRRKSSRVAPVVMSLGVLIAMAPWLIKNGVATGNPVFPLATKWFGYADGVWDSSCEQRWIDGHQPKASESSIAHRVGRLKDQILMSKQFGPIVPIGIASIIGATGLAITRRRAADRRGNAIDNGTSSKDATASLMLACGMMVAISLYVWMFHTHLVDRFAIALVGPFSLASAVALFRSCSDRSTYCGILGVGIIAMLNLSSAKDLFSLGQDAGAERYSVLDLEMFGRTDWMTSADSPFFPHVARINREIENGGRVLVVGDAKRFYLDAGADCCVVFNRYPFADAADEMSPEALLEWIGRRGYSHVYVDWVEMQRLRSTYGFWPSITPELFERLTKAGLAPIASFSRSDDGRAYSTLFKVPS